MKLFLKMLLTILCFTALSLCMLPGRAMAAPVAMPDGTLFDAEFYARRYPDVVEVFGTTDPAVMYRHYQQYGIREGRLPYEGADVTATGVTAAAAEAEEDPVQARVRAYFQNAVFIGDSIMVGYRNYLSNHKESPMSGALFLANVSYSAEHALRENDKLHPVFRGQKQPVWKAIQLMDVHRVFIMFGTNDLVGRSPERSAEMIFTVVDRIRGYNPAVQVNLISMTPIYNGGINKGNLNNDGVNALNALLREGMKEHHIGGFVDINSLLKDENGALAARYCSDHYVHQTTPAYGDVWDTCMYSFARERCK